MTKAAVKEIQSEIDHYRPPKAIAQAMLKLGELGFSFSGHGTGLGEEDFGVSRDFPNGYLYVSLSESWQNNQCRACYSIVLDNLGLEYHSEYKRPAYIVKAVAKLKTKKNILDFMKTSANRIKT